MAELTPSKKKSPGVGVPKLDAHNTIGAVCSLIKDDKNRIRCEAGKKLYDAAQAGRKSVQSAAAGIGTSGTVIGPLFFGLKSLYHGFQAADNLVAGLRQAYTGEETKTVQEILTEKAKKKAAELYGTFVEKRKKKEEEKKEEEKKEEKPQDEKPQDKPPDQPNDAPKDTPADKPYDGPMDPNQPVLDPNAPGPNPTPQDIESIPMV
jgi:Sec-independent protein translocase protein TatA